MRCIGCSELIKPSKAVESPTDSALKSNWTYVCPAPECGQSMTWTGRARTKPANAAPVEPRLGTHFMARPMTGTVLR